MSGGSTNPGFEAKLNISDFSPEEVTIHADDRYVTITGEHEERMDDSGYVGRHFIRRFMLPEDISTEHLSTQLSKEGILTIQAPYKSSVTGQSPDEAIENSGNTSSPNRPAEHEQKTPQEAQKS